MKSLKNYIYESLNIESVNEEKSKIFRVIFKDLDVNPDIYYSIEALSNKNHIYYEKIDNGFKIKIKEGDNDKLEGYIDILNHIIETHKEDENQDAVDYLRDRVSKLMDIAQEDDAPEEEPKDEPKEEPKEEPKDEPKEEPKKDDKKEEE